MSGKQPYWFPAKRFGWGWGPPKMWQGWVVLCTWLLSMAAALLFLLPQHLVGFLGCMLAMTLGLLLICYAKGEPPRWRGGSRMS